MQLFWDIYYNDGLVSVSVKNYLKYLLLKVKNFKSIKVHDRKRQLVNIYGSYILFLGE